MSGNEGEIRAARTRSRELRSTGFMEGPGLPQVLSDLGLDLDELHAETDLIRDVGLMAAAVTDPGVIAGTYFWEGMVVGLLIA